MKHVALSLWGSILVFVLASCAAKLDPEIKQRAELIPVLMASEIEGRSYELLAEVEGADCVRYALTEDESWLDRDEAYSEGMDRAAWKLRIAAAQVGADAIIHASCRSKLGWPSMDCGVFQTECKGHAIRWQSDGGQVAKGWRWPLHP